ncbi:MAG: hypothetical protein S4CHLAM81_05970 [Chlamydiales bacterium]|nr:hypothetical protein [Chlamydiales bacterium]MCH9635381.1 hypothetical protein [Chlamydiales bacterium]MCH9704206.1 LysM peptidoglycan-binding domain-containing protein [Chlamydiota bacterium]
MNRRDTIIIAVLVNAGLLMVLFATATRSHDRAEKPHKKVELAKELPTKQVLKEPELESFDDLFADTFSEQTEELTLADLAEPQPVIEEVVSPALNDNVVKVTVKSGDFLERIARNNNTTVAAIMKANGMTSTNLRVGQVLNVPVQQKASAPARTSNEAEYYVVKDGDSPWLIASKNRVKLDDLLKMNGLDEQKARRLRPGDKLRIR